MDQRMINVVAGFSPRMVLCCLCLLWVFPVQAQDKTAPVCSAEIQCTNCKSTVNMSDILFLNFFSTVSQPSTCLPADIRVSASYYDSEDNLICSGVIGDNITSQGQYIQNINVEVRPTSVLEFVRLKTPLTPPAKRLFCMNLDGNAEVSQTEIVKAASLRLRFTILPKNGGLATAECRMNLNLSR
jgi:hypothetical protein